MVLSVYKVCKHTLYTFSIPSIALVFMPKKRLLFQCLGKRKYSMLI